MNRLEKFDKFWIGLIAGLLFPMLVYALYWLCFHHQISFPQRFTRYLINGYLLSNVIKICGLGNLLLFYFSMTKGLEKFSKGVILSVLFYVGLIAYVTYYLEPELM